MKITSNKKKLTEEAIAGLYVDNKVQFSGNFNLINIIDSIKNCFLVVTAWENDKLIGLCSIISDGIYYGRIQELIITPDYKLKEELITLIIQYIYNEYPILKNLHLNPGVNEKRIIYIKKHSAKSTQMRKLFWSIHEDEF